MTRCWNGEGSLFLTSSSFLCLSEMETDWWRELKGCDMTGGSVRGGGPLLSRQNDHMCFIIL